MGKFSADVKAWGDKALKEFEDLRRAVILDLFSSVILDSPVDTGRLRGNWQIGTTAIKGELSVLDPSGNETTAKVENFVKGQDAERESVTVLTNNLPYAYRIEYDGWSHTKAPQGMVRKNFIRISQNLKQQYG